MHNKSFLNLLFLLGCLLSTYFSLAQVSKPLPLKPAFAFIDSIFTGNSFSFEEQEMVFPQEIINISLRFNEAVARDKEWFQEYTNKYYKSGKGAPYHEKFGITRKEYELFQKNADKPLELKTISVQHIDLERKNGIITFKGQGAFVMFNFLSIDLNKKIIVLGKDTLNDLSEINSSSSKAFGAWHGYSWALEQSNQPENNIAFKSLTAKIIHFNLGKTTPGNKLLLTLKLQRMENGANKQLFDILGFIK